MMVLSKLLWVVYLVIGLLLKLPLVALAELATGILMLVRFWTLAVAAGLDSTLLNQSNDSVNFAFNANDTFVIFASDRWDINNPHLFDSGSQFTVTVNFSDGSQASASTTTIPFTAARLNGTMRIETGNIMRVQ